MARRNVFLYDLHLFKSTSSGVGIYDALSVDLVNFAGFPLGTNAVWVNEDYLYVATSVSGIYRADMSAVSGTLIFENYKSYPDITSNEVRYIHGSGDYLCATTASGVDRYKLSTGERNFTYVDNADKCCQTSRGDYYYVVNNSNNIFNLDDSLYSWTYGRVIELSKPVIADGYEIKITIPLTQPGGIYNRSKLGGNDVRFIDDSGYNITFYRELWDYTSEPTFWLSLRAGTEKIYVLYGNDSVFDKSTKDGVFALYDNFDGTTLSNKWTFTPGHSSNNYVIANGTITLRCNVDIALYLTSVNTFIDGLLEYRFRRVLGSSNTDMDYRVLFGTTAEVTIGPGSPATEPVHTLKVGASTVVGSKYTSTEFKIHSIKVGSNHIVSDYDSETLTISGTFSPAAKNVRFTFDNASTQPNLEIDWVRIRSYDPNPPTYTVGPELPITSVIPATSVHAVYESGSGYTYTSAPNSIITSAYISDISVAEGTSIYGGGNIICLATSWGTYIIEEKRGDELNCRKSIYLIES